MKNKKIIRGGQRLKEKKGWLYNNHIYWKRPSCVFKDMFQRAVPILITYLPILKNNK